LTVFISFTYTHICVKARWSWQIRDEHGSKLTEYVHSDGRVFVEGRAWLDPGQVDCVVGTSAEPAVKPEN